jgi:hypothetical protein
MSHFEVRPAGSANASERLKREGLIMKAKAPATPVDYDQTCIVERPDGFYWQSSEGGREYGPFVSLREAMEDMDYAEATIEPCETLEQAESEIGIADWIDPDTGQPAEESIPRIGDC